MNSGLNPASPILVSAFRSALLHQCADRRADLRCCCSSPGARRGPRSSVHGRSARGRRPGASRARGCCCGSASASSGCSTGSSRRSRRWRAACADQVIQPAAATSPGWVQHLVNSGANIWDYHPIAGRRGVGVDPGRHRALADLRGARLVAPARRRWPSVAWGLVVWAFGEAFGGDLRARPHRAVRRAGRGAHLRRGRGAARAARAGLGTARRLGRLLLGGTGAFFLGMALLQAWPGRGFWQGSARRPAGLADRA